MKIVFLDAKTVGEDADLSVLEPFGTLSVFSATKPEETLERCRDADIVITNKVVIHADIMRQCEDLKLICIAATGMNNVDIAYAKEHHIEVKNVAGYSTHSVVGHTFAVYFYLMHQMRYYDDYVKSGAWGRLGLFTCIDQPFHELFAKRWGIIGLGSIGRAVAKAASAFGAEVVYYSTSGKNSDTEFEQTGLEVLLETSDIVSIHAPLNSNTANLLHSGNLGMMRPGAVLLNLGRGGIVNEKDLAEFLRTGNLYVGLDVLEREPMADDHPLLNVPHPEKLLITPHIAWASIEARKVLVEGIAHNIAAFIKRHTI